MKIPFDIKARDDIESGKYKVIDKDHHPVRIICWDKESQAKYGYHLVGLVKFGPNHEESCYYTIDGKSRLGDKEPALFLVTPKPELTTFEKAKKTSSCEEQRETGKIDFAIQLLRFLDTLLEESSVDLEKEIEDIWEHDKILNPDSYDHGYEIHLDKHNLESLARRFYDLGRTAKMSKNYEQICKHQRSPQGDRAAEKVEQ